MRKIVGYVVAAIIAILLYLNGTAPFWQMMYTLAVIIAVAAVHVAERKEYEATDH